VQAFFVDGAIGLHTRGHQFSKLRNGSLVVVPSALVQRCKSHFHLLPCGVHLVLGLNGYIWVSKPVIGNPESTDEADIERTYSNKNDVRFLNVAESLMMKRRYLTHVTLLIR
jgi:exosome complex component RRP4